MSALNLNTVLLAGHIVADPELKQTTSGVSVCSFTLAVNRRKAEGEAAPKTDFITVVAWRKTAEVVAQYFRKGSAICVSGRIEVRSYTDREGNKRNVTEVIAGEAYFVDSRQDSYPEPSAPPAPAAPPMPGYTQPSFPMSPKYEELNTDDDLPF